MENKKRQDLNMEKNNKSNMANLSQKWLELLVLFSYEYNKKLSGSEISRITKIPQRTVSRYLIKLIKKGILRFEERGNNKFYYLDLSDEKSKIILNLIESYKTFTFSQNNLLWKDLKELMPFGTFVLFGSYAKAYSTIFSDIDVVIFSKNTEKLKKILRSLPKVQAQIVSFENFQRLVLKKDVLALEILKNHIIFGELEDFIELCRRFYNG